MKLRLALLMLLIAAMVAALVLALCGFPKFLSALFWIYITGAVLGLIVVICLSDKEKLERPSVLWFFLSNELGLILFVALWPVLMPLVIAGIVAAKSKARGGTTSDDQNPET